MIAVALRSMAQRKLRSALTAVAILLGVAMIAGTYVQTDQIRTAMNDITRTANSGVDAQMAPRKAFTSTFGANDLIDQRTVVRASQCAGRGRRPGRALPDRLARGQGQGRRAEVRAGDRRLRDARALRSAAQRLRAAARAARRGARQPQAGRGRAPRDRPARRRDDAGRASRRAPGRHRRLRQRGLDRRGDADRRADGRRPGLVRARGQGLARRGVRGGRRRAAELVARLRQALPRSLEIKTGEQTAADDAKQANDSIGSFLTPALLAFSGAALLVGAFIIFNTFSISVAQRRREFALLRSIGATRRQVLFAVAAEALVLGVAASVLGLLCGLGFARALGALFDAAGWGIPRGGMELAPRTIVIGLSVGIGVTLLAALFPAVRATRVPPVAAMRDEALAEASPRSRRRQVATGLVGPRRARAPVQGLLGGGPASSRLSAMGLGSLLVFVGVALSARYVVRPLAAVVGWPLQRLGHATGELARDNATRNPARTAVTAAALMVGLGARGLRLRLRRGPQGLDQRRDRRPRKGRSRREQRHAWPRSSRAAWAHIDRVPSVVATAPQYLDQVQVNGAPRQRRQRSDQRDRPTRPARRLFVQVAARLRRRPPASRRQRRHRRGAVRQGARHPVGDRFRVTGADRPQRHAAPRSPSTATRSSCRA